MVRCRKLSNPRSILTVTVIALLAGCERPPAYVYVLEAPQSVELAASASVQTVNMGTPVVLHARRTTQGVWKRIPAKDLRPEQCWMAATPPTEEPEAADNVKWTVEPASAAKLNIDFRADRTRELTLAEEGVYTIMASTGAWCEPGRLVRAAPIRLTVERP
jgi:hypothetical protein